MAVFMKGATVALNPGIRGGSGSAIRKSKIVCIGDSITYVYHDVNSWTANYVNWGSNGYFSWANAYMGWPFDLVVGGLGGLTADTLFPYLASDVYPEDPGYCLVNIGTNDVDGSNTTAGTIAGIKAIYDDLKAHGITVISTTILPQWKTFAGFVPLDAANALILVDVNEWIKQYSLEQGHICVDFYGALVDPDATAAQPDTGILVDTKHPTTAAAQRMGGLIQETLKFIIPKYPALYRGNTLPTAEGIPNPAMRGTGGNVTDVNVTGTCADLWTIDRLSGDNTVTVAAEQAADSTDEIKATWQLITFDGIGVADSKFRMYDQIFNTNTTFTEGDIVEGKVEVEANLAGGADCIEIHCRFVGDAETMDFHCLKAADDLIDGYVNERITLKTPPIALPAMTTTSTLTMWINFYANAGDTGTVKLRNASVKKISLT